MKRVLVFVVGFMCLFAGSASAYPFVANGAPGVISGDAYFSELTDEEQAIYVKGVFDTLVFIMQDINDARRSAANDPDAAVAVLNDVIRTMQTDAVNASIEDIAASVNNYVMSGSYSDVSAAFIALKLMASGSVEIGAARKASAERAMMCVFDGC